MRSKNNMCLPIKQLCICICVYSTLYFLATHSNQPPQCPVEQRWTAKQIIDHMSSKPSRAYFADLFLKGGFRSGMEVGVADGRFSEHFLTRTNHMVIEWYMVEPFPNVQLQERFFVDANGTANFRKGSWARNDVGRRAHKHFLRELSTNERLLRDIADESLDFIYLDGAHDYENVKLELTPYYKKVRPGGVLAGHDYCNHGEPTLPCSGCDVIPRCGEYTEYGISHGKPAGIGVNQEGVVRAVQEWLLSVQTNLKLRHTMEDFTAASLAKDGMSYDLVITSTRNPSWFIVKPVD